MVWCSTEVLNALFSKQHEGVMGAFSQITNWGDVLHRTSLCPAIVIHSVFNSFSAPDSPLLIPPVHCNKWLWYSNHSSLKVFQKHTAHIAERGKRPRILGIMWLIVVFKNQLILHPIGRQSHRWSSASRGKDRVCSPDKIQRLPSLCHHVRQSTNL